MPCFIIQELTLPAPACSNTEHRQPHAEHGSRILEIFRNKLETRADMLPRMVLLP